MNYFDKAGQPQIDRRCAPRVSAHWRIGEGSVSTEELLAWQLGPVHSHWYGSPATRRPQRESRG